MKSLAILPTLKTLRTFLMPAFLLATSSYHIPLSRTFQVIGNTLRSKSELAYTCQVLVMKTYKTIFGLRHFIYGLENLPAGAKILTANHPNASDGIQLPLAFKERIKVIAQESLFHLPAFGWIITHAGHIPVRPEHRGVAFEQACDAISEGGSILIFPEGTLNPDNKNLKVGSGAIRMSLATGAPIVPIGISVAKQDTIKLQDPFKKFQSGRWQFRGQFIVRVGKAWWPTKEISHPGKPAEIHELTRCLMEKINGLVR